MTTLDARKSDKKHFFSVYKPGQGKYVRWGTVGGAAIIILVGAWWLGDKVLRQFDSQLTIAIGVMVWIALGALLTFWLVNKPKLAEFFIMCESEMRKVTWPSRKQVVTSTRVVIFMTLVLASLLWLVDVGFKSLFEWMKIL